MAPINAERDRFEEMSHIVRRLLPTFAGGRKDGGMSDTWVASGWWLASDGKWYPPAPEGSPSAPSATSAPVDVEPAPAAADAGPVIDLRNDGLVLDLRETQPKVLVPPPIPVVAEEAPTIAPDPPTPVVTSPGGRWGGHRVVASPVRSQVTQ
jgi:hypothetical protein